MVRLHLVQGLGDPWNCRDQAPQLEMAKAGRDVSLLDDTVVWCFFAFRVGADT